MEGKIMDYTVILNGQSYDLPKLTLTVKEKIEAMNAKLTNTSVSLAERVKAQHELLKEFIGAENLKEILGTSNVKDIDLNEISIVYVEICKSYEAPMKESKLKALPTEQINMMNELFKNLGNVSQLEKIIKQNEGKKTSFTAL